MHSQSVARCTLGTPALVASYLAPLVDHNAAMLAVAESSGDVQVQANDDTKVAAGLS